MSGALQLLFLRRDAMRDRAFLLPRAYRLLPLRALASGGPALLRSRALRESYRLLRLPEDRDSSPARAKEAYLRLAKLYHPDSGAATADAALFARVEEAYRAVLAHSSRGGGGGRGEEEAESEEEPVKGVAPQHRHYLSYEGVGSGTPSQRERRYRQFRADRAAEQVLDYRRREHERAAAAAGEGGAALAERDVRRRSRQTKITQAVERLVEDLILESMARGDFRNLSGAGKPLGKFQRDPYADPATHNLNRILLDNGYQPPWIATQRDIRETAAGLRDRLLQGRAALGDPMTPGESARWRRLCGSVGDELSKLNKTVDDFNLIVPMLARQMVHFSLGREADRAEKAARQRREEGERERERARETERERRRETERERTRASVLLLWIQNLLK